MGHHKTHCYTTFFKYGKYGNPHAPSTYRCQFFPNAVWMKAYRYWRTSGYDVQSFPRTLIFNSMIFLVLRCYVHFKKTINEHGSMNDKNGKVMAKVSQPWFSDNGKSRKLHHHSNRQNQNVLPPNTWFYLSKRCRVVHNISAGRRYFCKIPACRWDFGRGTRICRNRKRFGMHEHGKLGFLNIYSGLFKSFNNLSIQASSEIEIPICNIW